MQQEWVLSEELQRAKDYLIGSFPLRLDTQAALANFVAQVEYFGLGSNYAEEYPRLIGAVTREEVLRVAKAYLHPDDYVLVIVGNLQEVGSSEVKPISR